MMDTLGSNGPDVKRRRRHTPEFRAEVLEACEEPGRSVAAVARYYQLNANLIHKWRRDRARQPALALPAFVRLNHRAAPETAPNDATVKVTLSSEAGAVVLHWPFIHIDRLAQWLRQR